MFKEFLSILTQISFGCSHLELKKIVHRDLAARNCLLSKGPNDSNIIVKISDLGLARDIYYTNLYHIKSNNKLPLRWMAPESVLFGTFTTKSDVWSFGVVGVEVFNFGQTPYAGLKNEQVKMALMNKETPELPNMCPIEILNVLIKCFNYDEKFRPTFKQINDDLNSLLIKFSNYKQIYDKNNELKYEGELVENKMNGSGSFYLDNGDIYIGQFEQDKINGFGTVYYKNGDKYTGQFKENQIDGKGTFYYNNERIKGDKYIGELKNGKRHGQGVYCSSDGSTYEGNWKNGEKTDGPFFLNRKKTDNRKILTLICIFSIIILALILGLAIGLTRKSSNNNSPTPFNNYFLKNSSLYGSSSGTEFYDIYLSYYISKISISSSDTMSRSLLYLDRLSAASSSKINSIQIEFSNGENSFSNGINGGTGGTSLSNFTVPNGQYISTILICYGSYLNQIQFKTNQGNQSFVYGSRYDGTCSTLNINGPPGLVGIGGFADTSGINGIYFTYFTNNSTTAANNTCESNQCLNGTSCIADATSYSCNCPTGYYEINSTCQLFNPCLSLINVCLNGGTCILSKQSGSNYVCLCPPGTSGNNCQECRKIIYYYR
jgi:serine/threonine protein kinase